ncbi:uncharacterized protein (TIGR03435 family) [Granulicella aggregans]|uniref:Uncharacterized protein (TIGR03435 family) n=2 Tax=Granulicella aggregans TaxID=474949 RepID=A0A7W7ZJI2_9BACT|nr:uncharacterized protein (TIGR03435 family) [Granulicella aggregans]
MRRIMLLFIGVAASTGLCLAPAHSQNTLLPPHKLQFEVASIRESRLGGKANSSFPLDRSETYSPTGGSFVATNQSVVTLLIFAYKIKVSEFSSGLMGHLPKWATSERFDINARAGSESPTKDDMRSMVQSLLEDRFKLKAHREMQMKPVLGMHLTKSGMTGPQLRSHIPNSACLTLPFLATETLVPSLVGRWPATCGDGTELRISRYRLREGGRDMKMSAIADWLSGAGDTERPIVDKTGLQGTLDFVLEFDPESLDREGLSSTPRDDSGPNFIDAIKEQLGVQLKKEEDSITLFTIDGIEYPTAN